MLKHWSCCFLAMLMMLQGLAIAENSTSNVFQKMQLLRASNDLNQAIQLGQEHLKSHPQDTDVLLLMGLIDYQEKNFPKAIHYLNLALILSPHYIDAQLGLIRVALAQKDDLQAERLIKKAEQLSPRDIRIQPLKNQLKTMRPKIAFTNSSYLKMTNPLPEMKRLRKKSELKLAVTLGEHYLSVYPKNADILVLMGLIAYQKKNFSEAKIYLNQSLTYSPTYIDAQLGLIRVALAQKNTTKAKLLIQTAEQQSPHNLRIQRLRQRLQAMQSQAALTKPSYLPPITPLKPKLANPLPEMKRLREKNEIELAITLGERYLNLYPKDADVFLLIALLYYQKQDFDIATTYFNRVLVLSPNYIDANLGLIRIAIAEKKYKKATQLLHDLNQKNHTDPRIKAMFTALNNAIYEHQLAQINEATQQKDYRRAEILAQKMLLKNPSDQEVHFILGKIYVYQKKYQYGIHEFSEILAQNSWSKKARIALISTELAKGDDRKALSLVSESLALSPNDPDFLAERTKIFQARHMHTIVAHEAKKNLFFANDNEIAINQLQAVQQLNPHLTHGRNAFSADSEVDYISDLKEIWQYTTFAYQRNEHWGVIDLNLNNVTRFGKNANQGLANIYPVVNQLFFFRITGGYANEPVLFPTYTTGVEGYFSGTPVELSAGFNYYSVLPELSFSLHTASISKEYKDYWLSFRPNFYRPKHGKNSILYTLTLLRHFAYKDTYIRVMGGSGTSPDLANLTTVDFLIIRNNFVVANIQFPLMNHKLLVRIGGDYQRWVFPQLNNRLRIISGGQLGFTYRFEEVKNESLFSR